MTQRLQLDSHKLQYHPRLVADFLEGQVVVPLNAEISLTDACNHRCRFCNFNYLGHQQTHLPEGRAPELIREMAAAGVKAATLAGAGEPLLHSDLMASLRAGREAGMDMAMSTNGVLLKPEQAIEMPSLLTWIRFSVNGGTPATYSAVHQTRESDFVRAIKNIAVLATAKRRSGSAMTIGTQCVLVDENCRDIGTLAMQLRDAGADYFVVKHFYSREEGGYTPDMSFLSKAYLAELTTIAAELTTPSFSMVIRDAEKLDRERPYHKCLGLPFLVYVRENGLLYTCFSHQEDEQTAVGSILDGDFSSLWDSVGRETAIQYINEQYDKNKCQANCRHHQINLWLHSLQNPPAHVNFV